MRKMLLTLTLLLVVITTQAQENSEFRTQTLEFLKLTGTTKAFDDAIDKIGALVPQAKKAAYKEEANGTLAGLYSKVADLYMAEFTPDEIQELVTFYNSALGKKLASKQVPLMQKGMAIGRAWGVDLQAIAQKYQ